jgi:hypothetical protein
MAALSWLFGGWRLAVGLEAANLQIRANPRSFAGSIKIRSLNFFL